MNLPSQIDALLSQYEQELRQGHSITPEELCRSCPELLDELRRHLGRLHGLQNQLDQPTPDTQTPSTRVNEVVAAHSRYRPLELHAHGGLGEVLRARDETLSREVALKRMRPHLHTDTGSRQRFLREAEITARLEHPGVVPIYTMQHDNGAAPSYVMRFIQGESLAEAIRQLHAAQVDFGGLEFRHLLQRFISVCNTLGYAHSRGIIHRDLKPANIMLGKYGETLVVDWGLAKDLGRIEPEETANLQSSDKSPGQDLASPVPTPHQGDVLTAQGAVVGTPAFMSPEQAGGQADVVGPASDVYGLGATLFALLTGRAPFDNPLPGPLLRAVRHGEFSPPRQVNRGIPAALEAICLKAMALRAGDRYADAVALAHDIERWLADEPISAQSDPLGVRLRRWMRRHRTLVTTTAATSAAAIVILAGAAWLLLGAYRRESQAAEQARNQKLLAEENLETAEKVVDRFFYEVSQQKLLKLPGAASFRRDLLQIAKDHYLEFLKQRADDPLVEARVANTYVALGQIESEFGKLQDALPWIDKGLAAWRKILNDVPSDSPRRIEFALGLNSRGNALLLSGKPKEAESELREVMTQMQPLLTAEPINEKAVDLVVMAGTNLQMALGSYGRMSDAIEAALPLERLLADRLERKPGDLGAQRNLILVLQNRGCDCMDLNRNEEAVTAFAKGRDLVEAILAAIAADPSRAPNVSIVNDVRITQPALLNNLAMARNRLGETRWAAELYEEAFRHSEQLERTQPNVPMIRHRYVNTACNLSFVLADLEEFAKALAVIVKVRPAAEQLFKDDPARVELAVMLPFALDAEAYALARVNRRTEAETAFARADALHSELRKTNPEHYQLQLRQGGHYLARGDARRFWGQLPEALADLRLARSLLAKDGDMLLGVARGVARCLPLVDAAERNQLAEETIAILQQAAGLGVALGERLKRDEAFLPLRSRDAFQDLLGR